MTGPVPTQPASTSDDEDDMPGAPVLSYAQRVWGPGPGPDRWGVGEPTQPTGDYGQPGDSNADAIAWIVYLAYLSARQAAGWALHVVSDGLHLVAHAVHGDKDWRIRNGGGDG